MLKMHETLELFGVPKRSPKDMPETLGNFESLFFHIERKGW